MIFVGQESNKVEIEFHTKVVCCIWVGFLYKAGTNQEGFKRYRAS